MEKSEMLRLSKQELVDLIFAYSKLYTALDGLWYLTVEKDYGHETAMSLDGRVWESLLPLEAKRICEARGIGKGGVEDVVEAFRFRPTSLTKEVDVTKKETGAIVRVTKCRSLSAMERDKRDVLSCLKILKSYSRFVGTVDPKVSFRVLKAPPRGSADDPCCAWEIGST
jgi:hypothetical protein